MHLIIILGTVRAVVEGAKDANNAPLIASLSDYHPFGMTMQGRSFVSESYRYGYQGSERDNELEGGSAYTTHFRMLDVRLGRWFSPDVITQPWQSPYTSMDNNPIALIDIFGAQGGGPYSGGSGGGSASASSSTSASGGLGGGGTPTPGGDAALSGGMPFDIIGTSGADAAQEAGAEVNAAANQPKRSGQASKTVAGLHIPHLGFSLNENIDEVYRPYQYSWELSSVLMKRLPPYAQFVYSPHISSYIIGIKWISQYNSKVPNHGDFACKDAAELIIKDHGIANYKAYKGVEVLGGDDPKPGDEDVLLDAGKVQEIIDSYLEESKPVAVGVNRKKGTQSSLGNKTITDHWVVIVGKGEDEKGTYYRFYEVGTSYEDKGASSDNKLYLKNGKFIGGTAYKTSLIYTLSQIRIYKK